MIEFDDHLIYGTGKEAAVAGFANELIVLAMLMTNYPNSSKVDMPLASYDIIIERTTGSHASFLRAQVKTASKSIPFTGGSRGGVDRSYDPQIHQNKQYTQNITTSDLVIGIHRSKGQTVLYLIPTLIISILGQKSLANTKADVFSDWQIINLCDKESELKEHLRQRITTSHPLMKTDSFNTWIST